jgi:hypothetical protein
MERLRKAVEGDQEDRRIGAHVHGCGMVGFRNGIRGSIIYDTRQREFLEIFSRVSDLPDFRATLPIRVFGALVVSKNPRVPIRRDLS